MPSLPTRNDCPESRDDSYRRYLPPNYQRSFEASKGESELVVFGSFFSFLFICIFVVLVLLLPNWGFMYLKNYLDQHVYDHYKLNYLHDLYWYLILSLYSYCFTKLCYRKMPKEHIVHPFKLFKHHWKLSLYIISFMVCLFMYSCNTVLYYSVKYITNDDQDSSELVDYHILCNIQDCNRTGYIDNVYHIYKPIYCKQRIL